jgi:hypothetical protein
VDGSGGSGDGSTLVGVEDVGYVIVWSLGAGRQPLAGESVAENSTCNVTFEIGAGGVCWNTPLNTASVVVA